eukprot:SAG31_NODE_2385_length_5819_cov_3.572902_7_plen_346_part_00
MRVLLSLPSCTHHHMQFPLLRTDGPNPMELFQIWLNLPKKDKMADPCFKMVAKPIVSVAEPAACKLPFLPLNRCVLSAVVGRADYSTEFWPAWKTGLNLLSKQHTSETDHVLGQLCRLTVSLCQARVMLITGQLEADGTQEMQTPPPASWANDPHHMVAIWTITMDEGAEWMLPPVNAVGEATPVNRMLYFFRGSSLEVGPVQKLRRHVAITLDATKPCSLKAATGGGMIELLLLQGAPIDEPVVSMHSHTLRSSCEMDLSCHCFDDSLCCLYDRCSTVRSLCQARRKSCRLSVTISAPNLVNGHGHETTCHIQWMLDALRTMAMGGSKSLTVAARMAVAQRSRY